MSGYSKWATTKHKRAVIDAKRSELFAKLIKNVEVATRLGGGDPGGNPTLHDAIQKAKKSSVPNDNIDRVVKRGSGVIPGGADYEAIMYEVHGPSGITILIECLTDNWNRSTLGVHVAVIRNDGIMADVGSVQCLFARKKVVMVLKQQENREVTEDDLLEAALEMGLEEVNDEDEAWEAVCDPGDTVEVRKAIEAVGLDYDSSEVQFVASFDQDAGTVEFAQKIFRTIDALEDSDDVQNIFTSLNFTPGVIAALDSED